MTAVAVTLIVAGVAFIAISGVGLLRLPDVYTRAHAVAKSETLGLLLVFLGTFFLPGVTVDVFIRIVLIAAFALLANPTAVHALATAARRSGVAPWTSGEAVTPRDPGGDAAEAAAAFEHDGGDPHGDERGTQA